MAKTKDQSLASGSVKKRKRDRGEDGRHTKHKKQRSKDARDRANGDGGTQNLGDHKLSGPGDTASNGTSTRGDLTPKASDHAMVINGNSWLEKPGEHSAWRVGEAMGGHLLGIDPIFSSDEQ
jgi:hypothetical protein